MKINGKLFLHSTKLDSDNGSIYINKTKTIYCFGGYNGSSWLNTMEKLELTGPSESYAWKLLNINPNQANYGYDPILYQVSSDEIVVFRGNNTSEVYLFNSKESTMKTYDNNGSIKPLADYHYGCQQYRYQDSIYSVGSYNGHLHMFDPKKREYKSLTYDQIKQ